MKKILFIFLAVICLLKADNCYTQWQSDLRLTNDPAFSALSYNNAWCIALSSDVVHVIWNDNRDGNLEIYYKRSTDGGISWGTDTRLTNNSAGSQYPSISVSVSVVHVVWSDSRDGNGEIYYKRSTDGGISWGSDTRLTNDTAGSQYPSVSVSVSVVQVVWHDNRDGNQEIYYKRSTDGGISWGADTRLTNNSAGSQNASVSVSGSFVHVVWQDYRDGSWEIHYKRSADGGVSWGADTQLSNNNLARSDYPSVTVYVEVVHVTWYDNRDGNPEIYYKRSTDGGISWGSDTRLTNNSANSQYPSISVSTSFVHVVWQDQRDGNGEIYYKRSTNGGISWETDTRLTNNSAGSGFPCVSVSGQVVHVVFIDMRDGNWEIYYKRNPTGNVVGIVNTNSEFPEEFSLSQNYPNPFNPVTTIRFVIPTDAGIHFKNIQLNVYNGIGQLINSLVNESLSPGEYEVEFNGNDLSSGLYFYSLSVDRKVIDTKKMLLLK